jgi:hypothetical protein
MICTAKIQYPNQNKILCLTLWKDNKLTVTLLQSIYYPNDTEDRSAVEVDILYLIKDLSIFSEYDRLLALEMLAQTNFNPSTNDR